MSFAFRDNLEDKIDTDTMIISSAAGIFGPAFIAPVARQLLRLGNVLHAGAAHGMNSVSLHP